MRAPAKLLDLRYLMRTRLSVWQRGTLLKCRIQAAMGYAITANVPICSEKCPRQARSAIELLDL